MNQYLCYVFFMLTLFVIVLCSCTQLCNDIDVPINKLQHVDVVLYKGKPFTGTTCKYLPSVGLVSVTYKNGIEDNNQFALYEFDVEGDMANPAFRHYIDSGGIVTDHNVIIYLYKHGNIDDLPMLYEARKVFQNQRVNAIDSGIIDTHYYCLKAINRIETLCNENQYKNKSL